MKFSNKQIVWGAIIFMIIIVGFFSFTNKKTVVLQATVAVKRGAVVQEVSVTGRVKPTRAVDLGFEKSGRVSRVYVHVGNYIDQGAVLAEINSSDAEGGLLEAEARLTELKRGSRPEEIAVKEAELKKYIQDLNNSFVGISDIINDASNKADDALHSKTAGVFSGFKTSSYKYAFSVCDSQLAISGEWLRLTEETNLDLWRSEIASLPISPSNVDLEASLDRAGKHLESLKLFLENVNRALTLDCTIANTALDTYRTNISTARTNITTALLNVNTRKQSIATLSLAVSKVRDELSLLKAGTASEVVAAQEARVLSARGELTKYRITAPIAGIVTKIDIKAGEMSSAGKIVFSIISNASFQIEANVPEADIAKIKIGDRASITLDAYGSDEHFEARVSAIDPAETVIDNVPTYKVTLHFSKNDARIKSGMTANIDISTASREQVLLIPERSVIVKDGARFVRKTLPDGATSDVPIAVGLKGSDGSIEILSGIEEGTSIIMAPKD